MSSRSAAPLDQVIILTIKLVTPNEAGPGREARSHGEALRDAARHREALRQARGRVGWRRQASHCAGGRDRRRQGGWARKHLPACETAATTAAASQSKPEQAKAGEASVEPIAVRTGENSVAA